MFSPDSRTAQFNRAVDRIKQDSRCIEVLGNAKKITAHGEETANKWRRARPISYDFHNREASQRNLLTRSQFVREV